MNNEILKIPREWHFLGIRNLRKANVQYPYTDYQIEEIGKCSTDHNYFFKNYIKIVSLDSGIIPLELRDYQDEMVLNLDTYRFNIFMLPRQVGKTIICTAYYLWKMLFNEFEISGVVANKDSMALKIIKEAQFMYLNLPFWLQQGVKTWQKRGFELENGSMLISQATSGSALRGFSIKNLLWDECAFVKGSLADDFLSSIYPTIVSSKISKVTIASTPFGYNHFAKLWLEAKENKNEFHPFEIAWNKVPGRDEEFKRVTIANVGQISWNQEFECKIIGSSNTLISGAILETLHHIEPITTTFNGDFKLYHIPENNRQYVIIIDTSEGKSLDYHAIQVIDITELPYKQIATYRNNKINYLSFPHIADQVIRFFGENSIVLIENNNLGQDIAYTLFDEFETPCIFYYDLKEIGIKTTKKSRNMGCVALKDLIELFQLEIIDFHTISELYKFVLVNNKYQAAVDDTSATDDLVMCLVLFGYFTKTNFFKQLFEANSKKLLNLQKTEIENEYDMPFPAILSRADEETVFNNSYLSFFSRS